MTGTRLCAWGAMMVFGEPVDRDSTSAVLGASLHGPHSRAESSSVVVTSCIFAALIPRDLHVPLSSE